MTTSYVSVFNEMNRSPIADMAVANLREETRIRGSDATYVAPTFDTCFDNTKGFGED